MWLFNNSCVRGTQKVFFHLTVKVQVPIIAPSKWKEMM